MNEISNFITTVGFPIAIACCLLYLVYSLGKMVIEKILLSFDVITRANEELLKTNSLFASRMDNIEDKVDSVLVILEKREVV